MNMWLRYPGPSGDHFAQRFPELLQICDCTQFLFDCQALLSPFIAKFKKYVISTFYREMCSEVVRIGIITIFHPSKL